MKTAVRPSTPADAPAITALLLQAGLRPNIDPDQLYWKYWQERDDWKGARSFVLARGEEILAHTGIVPGSCAWTAGRGRIVHMIDWAARPGAAGAGVSLMKSIGRTTDVLLSVGGSEDTRKLLPHLGFHALGTATGFVRPLHPTELLKRRPGSGWRQPFRFARSLAWAAAAPSHVPGTSQVRRIDRAEIACLDSVLPRAGRNVAVLERSGALFRYMLDCPIVPMELYSFAGSERVLGYFLLAFAPGQARLADCWIDSDDPTDWQALIQHAVLRAKSRPGVAEIVAQSSDAALSRNLLECGFHARRAEPIHALPCNRFELPPEPLRVQMLDNDAAYHHRSGRQDLWA
jgi:hypothetical protein